MGVKYVPIMSPYPGASAALGANYIYWTAPTNLTIVGVSAAPSADDTDLTIAVNDDGSATIAAFACADADVPGTWESTHLGGTNDPVYVAADSKISFTAANAANGTQILVVLAILEGEAAS
jgi:hypothetical protein